MIDALPPADRPQDTAVRRFTSTVCTATPTVRTAAQDRDPDVAARRRFAGPELSVSGARDLVGRCLAGWGVVPEAIDDARQVASALVAHVIRHDHATHLDIEVVDLHERVTVVVEFAGTAGDGTGRPHVPTGSATSGRGLAVVDGIAERWGRVEVEGGGRAWAVLAAPRVEATGVRPGARSTNLADTDSATEARPARAGELLVRLAEALAPARTATDVARAVAAVTRRGVDAFGVRVALVDDGRRHLTSLALAHQEGFVDDGRSDDLDRALPSSRVARTGRPLHLHSRAAVAAAVPALALEPGADGVEALAALPLVVDGRTTGVLTVVWNSPRDIGPEEQATLTAVATFASSALQRATLADEHRATAAVLQATLLPQALPELPGLDLATVYRPLGPSPDVGGDWYDAFALPGGNLVFVIGDVAGHGTSAARTMGKIRFSARAYAIDGAGPAEVLARTNALLRHHGHDLLASMLCVEYDPERRVAVVADAGHPPAMVVPVDGPARFVPAPIGPMLGATDEATYRTTTYAIAPRETLVLFTDGLVERRDTAIDDSLDDLAVAATEMRRFRTGAGRLATALADRRAASDVVTDDVCVLAVAHA